MENATKALLIAAAILIAILIISLSLVVYRMASETINSVNLSEAEMAQFNGKFDTYVGDTVSGSSVNALLTTVFTHNSAETAAGTNRYVKVLSKASASATATEVLNSSSTTIKKVPTGKFYTVELTYANGLVSEITYTAK